MTRRPDPLFTNGPPFTDQNKHNTRAVINMVSGDEACQYWNKTPRPSAGGGADVFSGNPFDPYNEACNSKIVSEQFSRGKRYYYEYINSCKAAAARRLRLGQSHNDGVLFTAIAFGITTAPERRHPRHLSE
ncbi:hypothetical protein EVAR_39149_1 [Eumeta japonica]|uniref:Uncharacterized protein n=1 Tax=Eumeta variegata TaxID=151549 RepID=A0A4C1X7B3_EUMVA|nr:hypothetical protein EVAR_39149_1 [Eumeta japonica]